MWNTSLCDVGERKQIEKTNGNNNKGEQVDKKIKNNKT